ncbi:MAG: glycerophosphodiester phosphodiesterase family protein [Christensenella sp.]|nr:glycerophosphodiester phosphodiesterase family protein [Christensenella sp.]
MATILILLLILAVLLGLWVFLAAPGASGHAQRAPFSGRLYAHRGLYTKDQTIPENSLPAFAAARERRYGVELDVQLSKDGDVVVFHDDDLKRVCGVDARVDALTTQELFALRLFESGERMPLFTEVMAALGPETPVIVELKSGPSNDPLCEKTLALLRAIPGIYCVESFDPRIVAWFRTHAPDILRGQLVMPFSFYKGSRVTAFFLSNLLLNVLARPQFLARETTLKSASLWLSLLFHPMRVVWTVRPKDDFSRLRRENDAIIFEHFCPVEEKQG